MSKMTEKDVVDQITEMLSGIEEITHMCTDDGGMTIKYDDGTEFKVTVTRVKKTGIKPYGYEWTTAEEIIKNINVKRKFNGWGETTLTEIAGESTKFETYRKAHELWLKLKEAFNAEAKTYDPKAYNSALGSIGEVTDREVARYSWWKALNGDAYGDYDVLTSIIETLHGGETIETGTINFGS